MPVVYSLPHLMSHIAIAIDQTCLYSTITKQTPCDCLEHRASQHMGATKPGQPSCSCLCCMPLVDGGLTVSTLTEACLWEVLYGSSSQLRKHITKLMRNCCTSVRGAEEGQQGGGFGRKGRCGGGGGGLFRCVVRLQLFATTLGPQN